MRFLHKITAFPYDPNPIYTETIRRLSPPQRLALETLPANTPKHTQRIQDALRLGEWTHPIWNEPDIEKSLLKLLKDKKLNAQEFLCAMINWTGVWETRQAKQDGTTAPYTLTPFSVFTHTPSGISSTPTSKGQIWLSELQTSLNADPNQLYIAIQHSPHHNVVWKLEFRPAPNVASKQKDTTISEIGHLMIQINSNLLLPTTPTPFVEHRFIPSPLLLRKLIQLSGGNPITPRPVLGKSHPLDIASALKDRSRDVALSTPDALGFNKIAHRFNISHLGVLLHDYLLHNLLISDLSPREVRTYLTLADCLHRVIIEHQQTKTPLDDDFMFYRNDLIDMPPPEKPEFLYFARTLFYTGAEILQHIGPTALRCIQKELVPTPYPSLKDAILHLKEIALNGFGNRASSTMNAAHLIEKVDEHSRFLLDLIPSMGPSPHTYP